MVKVTIRYSDLEIEVDKDATFEAILEKIQRRYWTLFPKYAQKQYTSLISYSDKTLKELNLQDKIVIGCNCFANTASLQSELKLLIDDKRTLSNKCAQLELEIQKAKDNNIQYKITISQLSCQIQVLRNLSI